MKSIDKIGRVTAVSVKKGTGKDWDQWLKILNQAGAKSWSHQEIVAFLKKKYKLQAWWQQGVTHGFEVAVGRRIDGQSLKGEYGTVTTRTFPISAKRAWKLMTSPDGLALWLSPMSPFKIERGAQFECEGGIFGEVRTVKVPARARLTWQDTEWSKPSILQLNVVARGPSKSIVIIGHGELRTAQLQKQMREHWKVKLAAMFSIAKGDS